MIMTLVKKWSLLLFYVLILFVIVRWNQPLITWLQTEPSLPLLFLGATLFSLFPVIPYPVIGGILGRAYGVWGGGFIAWVGSTAASIILFVLVRYVLQAWAQRWIERSDRLGRWSNVLEQQSFFVVLFARMIPIIPSVIINVYAGLGRMSLISYSIASAVGKIPAMMLFALVGEASQYGWESLALSIAVYVVFGVGTWFVYRLWQRKKRPGDKNGIRKE